MDNVLFRFRLVWIEGVRWVVRLVGYRRGFGGYVLVFVEFIVIWEEDVYLGNS